MRLSKLCAADVKEFWLGFLEGEHGLHIPGEVFEAPAHFQPKPDGSWGSYAKVVGPFSSKLEAQKREWRPDNPKPDIQIPHHVWMPLKATDVAHLRPKKMLSFTAPIAQHGIRTHDLFEIVSITPVKILMQTIEGMGTTRRVTMTPEELTDLAQRRIVRWDQGRH